MVEINGGVVAYNLWLAQILNVFVKVCTLWACMHLRGTVNTVTLLTIMIRMSSLDEQTLRVLRFINQIKNRMFSV
jgi:hypothetical protein